MAVASHAADQLDAKVVTFCTGSNRFPRAPDPCRLAAQLSVPQERVRVTSNRQLDVFWSYAVEVGLKGNNPGPPYFDACRVGLLILA